MYLDLKLCQVPGCFEVLVSDHSKDGRQRAQGRRDVVLGGNPPLRIFSFRNSPIPPFFSQKWVRIMAPKVLCCAVLMSRGPFVEIPSQMNDTSSWSAGGPAKFAGVHCRSVCASCVCHFTVRVGTIWGGRGRDSSPKAVL